LRDDLGRQLAVVLLLDVRQTRSIRGDQVGQAPQQAAALGGRQRRPGAFGKSAVRGGNGSVDVVGVATRDPGPGEARKGIVRRQVVA
jgi:hypothetical protein